MRNKLHKGAAAVMVASSMTALHAVDPGKLLLYTSGPLALKPQFNTTETFNDNITYRSHDQKADLITTVSPGLTLQVGRREFNYYDLTYFYDRLLYADNSAFDANQHRISDRLHLRERRLMLDGNDTVEYLATPLGGGLSAGNDRGEGFAGLSGRKVDRWMISDLYRLTWDVTDRTDLYVQLYHASLNYQGDLPLYDQRSVQGTLGFEFHPFAKTYFFGETYYGQTENDRNVNTIQEYPTVNFVGMFLGARGQFTERLHGTAKAGFEHRFYAGRGDSLDSPVVEISLDEQLSERTLLTLGYSRRQYESIQLVQSAYSMDSIAMTWQQQIGSDGRLKSLLRASYLRSVFDKTAVLVNGREDNLLSASLTLAYDIKLWLRAFGSYNFEHLHSSERSIVNYYVNRVTLGLQLGY